MSITYTNYETWILPILQEDGQLVNREVVFSCRDEPNLKIYVICRQPFGDDAPVVMSVSVIGDDGNSKYVCCRPIPMSDDERRAVIDAFHAGPKEGIDMTADGAPHTTDYGIEVA